ncbi:hypothetical protein [Mesomycoplasma ovipneumoniae]|uniref:hypothetical protein n=1 Tax=Mesomycoplasma ovipneumoniae TaxID=29562 RepID=UPI0029654814|nr:hypothetical protein [Mesomycoplasma ovipneumoniae]MDW2861065.1 hypothetical protein [Mesomycoplasma ovipneumoniae]
MNQKNYLRRSLNILWQSLNWIALPFFAIAFILWHIFSALFLRLGQLLLGFIVIGGLLAGIIRLFAYIVTGY